MHVFIMVFTLVTEKDMCSKHIPNNPLYAIISIPQFLASTRLPQQQDLVLP
mgnify:CR=1 FL=1